MKYHDPKDCDGQFCCIHNPSGHLMKDWPMNLRESTLMERICIHGIGHPDPDSLAYFKRIGKKGYDVHGCDGCCTGKRYETQADAEAATEKVKEPISVDQLCANCNMREGTLTWSGTLGSLGALRAWSSLPKWCELCVAREQLKFAQEQASAIPELEAKIAKLVK